MKQQGREANTCGGRQVTLKTRAGKLVRKGVVITLISSLCGAKIECIFTATTAVMLP